MQRRHLFIALATAIGLATAGGVQAQNYKSEYKLSTVVPASFPWGKGGEIWIDLVKQRTNGRINIKMYPGVSLVQGDQTREFTAIRQGIIDMAIGSTINWSPQVKELNLFSLPFLMPDYKAIDALTQGPVGKDLFGILEKQGVVPLAWGENGFRELTNSKREVRKPDDLKGLKIRVVGSPLFLATFQALGANPTQMSWADAQPAFASKAVDGQENPMSIFTAAKLHNVGQKFVTMWGYVADPLIFVVNKEVWESWTPADREIVRQAAIDAGKVTPQQSIQTAPGKLTIGGRTIGDAHAYGLLTVAEVVAKSSNVGMVKIALSLKPQDMWSELDQFGFGRVTGSGFPGESAGILTSYQHWRPIGQATMAYGYGLSVTPLQLAQAYAVLGAAGIRRPVSLRRLESVPAGERVLDETVARELVTMMEAVVGDQGTARRARVMGYRVAGKTGTAWKASETGGYSTNKYMAVFGGVVPASQPRLAAVVVIDEPTGGAYYGGEVAAPVFATVMSGALRLLAIPPDDLQRMPATTLVQAQDPW